MIRALVVDDEAIARARIRRLLRAHEDIQVIRECDCGVETVEAIRRDRPDLVFLDIQLADMDAFEVIRRVGRNRMPPVIFLTAHEEHAVRGFEVDALDYLLKPFDAERFTAALGRFRRRAAAHETPDAVPVPAPSPGSSEPALTRILLHERGARFFLRVSDIEWIQAAVNYSRIQCGKKQYLHRLSLAEFERKLDPGQFARIHRSTIVNLDFVGEIRPWFSGDQILTLKDGTELRVSRTYRDRLKRWS